LDGILGVSLSIIIVYPASKLAFCHCEPVQGDVL
jgi:hypothetical protein